MRGLQMSCRNGEINGLVGGYCSVAVEPQSDRCPKDNDFQIGVCRTKGSMGA